MHSGDGFPIVTPETAMGEVIASMTGYERKGAAGVVDEKGELIGIITDGDIRRRVGKDSGDLRGTAKDLMSLRPKLLMPRSWLKRLCF